MSTVKLTYFQLKALGEPIRWLLKYGGIDFEDIRVEFDDWPKVKPTVFFGQLPVYEEDGKKVNQSVAICRYLAKRMNLVGDSDWENLEVDAIVDTINDLRLKLMKYSYEKDEKIKEEVKGPLFNEILPFYLEKFEEIAKTNNGHLAINKLTWADFYFIAVLDYFNYMAEMDLLTNRPFLQKVNENVVNVPIIKEWIAKRPNTYMYMKQENRQPRLAKLIRILLLLLAKENEDILQIQTPYYTVGSG